jgi:xanthine dehydrogenase YagS FAD-binding subunit
MKPFAYVRPTSREEAQSLLTATARPKGGGMDLLDLAKSGVSSPETLVDLSGIADLAGSPGGHGEIFLSGAMTLAQIAESPEFAQRLPAISDAAEQAATPLVRNRATLAGCLLQRPRCTYFRDPFFDCLKRGGKTCPSMEGDHAEGAIFGNRRCCAVHPSNLATALSALDAKAALLGGRDDQGNLRWRWPDLLGEFWVAPEEDPLREARIEPGELLTLVMVQPSPASAYVEIDQKQSFDWASASCAVALQMEGGKVESARIVLGAVAPIPWRAKVAEEALAGKVPDAKAAAAAAEAAVKGATPLRDNAHKVQHAKVCVQRAILKAAERGR